MKLEGAKPWHGDEAPVEEELTNAEIERESESFSHGDLREKKKKRKATARDADTAANWRLGPKFQPKLMYIYIHQNDSVNDPTMKGK